MTEPQSDINAAIRIQAIKKGILLGAIIVALNIFSFYFVTAITKSPAAIIFGLGLFQIILPVAFAVVFTMLIRQNIGGYWGLRQAVTGAFIMMLISFAILTIGRDWIFGKVIEPQMLNKTEAAMESTERARYQQQKLPQKQADSLLNDKRQQFVLAKKATAFNYIEGYLETIILLFVAALVLGAIFKKQTAAARL